MAPPKLAGRAPAMPGAGVRVGVLLLALHSGGSVSSGSGADAGEGAWRRALPGWDYRFPRDHFAHPEFKTEWWYLTGNLADETGRRFGYQLTFFRQGVIPPGALEVEPRVEPRSRFVVRDVHFAHAALTDPAGEKFLFHQKLARGSFGESGFGDGERVAWIDDWELRADPKGGFRAAAEFSGARLALNLKPLRPPLIHGRDGVSPKSPEPGNASHYYSLSRLETAGTLRIGGRELAVQGLSWFDREWGTSQLSEKQAGWDWFSVQLEDGTDLMLFQIRDREGRPDGNESGTWAPPDEAPRPLGSEDFRLEPRETWRSRASGASYPVRWRLAIPSEALECEVRGVLADQELRLDPVCYWEGAVEVEGTRGGRPLSGRGYMELTGYREPVTGLR